MIPVSNFFLKYLTHFLKDSLKTHERLENLDQRRIPVSKSQDCWWQIRRDPSSVRPLAALPVLQARAPAIADTCVRHLAMGGDPAPSLKGAAEARILLQNEGWGANAFLGMKSSGVPAHLDQVTKAWPKATGRMAGNIMHRALATNTFANAFCCLPCRRPPVPSSDHKLVRKQEHG